MTFAISKPKLRIIVPPEDAITNFRGEYKFLSNFEPAPIIASGKYFPTSEHLYMMCKTLDPEERELIRLQPTPGKAKRAGRRCALRDDWEHIKYKVMWLAVTRKFQQNKHLMERLKNTDTRFLLEGNTWGDRIWGATPTKNGWLGRNWLGDILMKVRKGEHYSL